MGFLLSLIAGVYTLMVVAVYFGQTALLYFPTADIYGTPEAVGLSYESVHFETADGVRLHAWYVPAASAEGTLLFFHGNAGNISHRLDSLKIFNDLNLNVLIFDYRGYGRSEGRMSESGSYRDAEAALRYLMERTGLSSRQIIYFGRSLGGAIAARLASIQPPEMLIIESTFTSVPDLGAELYPFLPVKLLSRLHYGTRAYLKRVNAPVLVVHSRDDEIISIRHGRALYKAANDPKAFLEMGGGHNDGFLVDRANYMAGLAEFIKTYRGRPIFSAR